ncbi:MAG: hypothetical protein ABR579_05180 [Actinomycetota bacterium]
MSVEKDLYAQVRALDVTGLRRLAIFVRGLLEARGEHSFAQVRKPSVTYRLQSVRCGKPGCNSCPHGPYWYAYYREGGRLRSHYLGKTRPEGTPGSDGNVSN